MNNPNIGAIVGRVWVFGDNISTDLIMPAALVFNFAVDPIARRQAIMPNRPGWSEEVTPGDIIVAGRNFGCGSSRRAPRVLAQELGIGAVIAESFARVFQRNAVNIGFPAVPCLNVREGVAEGDVVSLDVFSGEIHNQTSGTRLVGEPLPPGSPPAEILRLGGLRNYLRQWVQEHPEVRRPREQPAGDRAKEAEHYE